MIDMKIKAYIYHILTISLLSGLLFACEEDDSSGGNPSIAYIANPSVDGELLESAELGQTIAIIGSDLSGICQIFFNDQEAVLLPSYVTDAAIIVDVPNAAPVEIDDQLKLIFCSGVELAQAFPINVPGPSITLIKSEYVPTGVPVTIQGDFFFEPLTVSFTGVDGLVPATVQSFSQTEILVEVPDGSQSGPITVTTSIGEAVSDGHFRDNRFVFGDFSAESLEGSWHGAQWVSVNPDIPELDGSYINPQFATLNDGSYLEFFVGPSEAPGIAASFQNIPVDALNNPDNYSLKFELFTIQPIPAGANMKIHFSNNMPGLRNASNYDYTFEELDTQGEWITVSIPFGPVMDAQDQTALDGVLGWSFWWWESVDLTTDFEMDFAMDNFRLAPN